MTTTSFSVRACSTTQRPCQLDRNRKMDWMVGELYSDSCDRHARRPLWGQGQLTVPQEEFVCAICESLRLCGTPSLMGRLESVRNSCSLWKFTLSKFARGGCDLDTLQSIGSEKDFICVGSRSLGTDMSFSLCFFHHRQASIRRTPSRPTAEDSPYCTLCFP